MVSEPLLKVEHLKAGYGEEEVLHGINVEVRREEVVGVLGPNGAGKTTLLKAIMGLVKIREGRVIFDGKNVTALPTHRILKHGICYVPQGGSILTELSVEENLELGGYILNNNKLIEKKMEEIFELFPILKERRKNRAGTLSGGERQMLALGRALMLEPSLILMDEPSLGLAPRLVSLIFEKIREMNDRGTTILLVEQNARKALEVIDRAYIMAAGNVVKLGSAEELSKSSEIRDYYLGRLYQ